MERGRDMKDSKRIALVAHDNCKKALLEFVENNLEALHVHELIATGTTGGLIERLLNERMPEREKERGGVFKLKSGPLGGDQQLGALIAEGGIDVLIFFWDPMEPQPHDVDVKALLRLSVLYNIPTASNMSSAEFLVGSPYFHADYTIREGDFSEYLGRSL